MFEPTGTVFFDCAAFIMCETILKRYFFAWMNELYFTWSFMVLNVQWSTVCFASWREMFVLFSCVWRNKNCYLWISDILACTVKLSSVTMDSGIVGCVAPTGVLLMVSKSAAIGRVK